MTLETANSFKTAGVARATAELTDAIIHLDSDHEFHLFARPSLEIPERWRRKNVFVHRMKPPVNLWMHLQGGVVARKLGLDHFFSTSLTVPRFGGVSTGMILYDFFPLDHPEWFEPKFERIYRYGLGYAMKRADVLTSISQATKDAALRIYGPIAERIVVTPLGPGNAISPSAPDPEIPYARYIFTLSTIEPRKNLGTLFEAFARLRSDAEFGDVGLVVGGGKGWLYEEALAKIAHLGLTDAVTMLGYVPDERVPGLYSGCDLYICPSLEEGFGLPVLEAMMAGAPVVSSSAGALSEVAGDAALYFDPLNAAEMAEVMAKALRDPEGRARRRAIGIERAKTFRWDTCAETTLREIERAARR